MVNEKGTVDQGTLAQSVADKINYEFVDELLIKPLDPIKVTKEFSTPVAKGAPTTKDGVEAVDYDEVATEVKDVESDFREGIVLKLPLTYEVGKENNTSLQSTLNLKVGDKVLFNPLRAKWFDLVKDTMMLRLYDIVAVAR